MKTTLRILSILLALFMLVFCIASCNDTPAGGNNNDAGENGENSGDNGDTTPSLWDNATYTEDITLGEGAYTLAITVEMENKSIVITVLTDAATVKDALAEHSLIAGEQQSIGYMMSSINGVRADWTLDGAYWAFYQNGNYMMSGIDSTPIEGDAAYEFVYTPAW